MRSEDVTVSDAALRVFLYLSEDPESWCLTLAEIRSLPEVRS